MRLALLCVLPAVIVGCESARFATTNGPAVVMPAHFAEGEGEPGKTPPAGSASAAHSGAAPPASASAGTTGVVSEAASRPSGLPDPEPLRTDRQVVYDLEYRDGRVTVLSVTARTLAQPVVTPRRMGRFAVELGVGSELIERVRFDFPGTAADEPKSAGPQPLNAPLSLAERAVSRLTIAVPNSPRATRALLIDRARETATPLPWPADPASGGARTAPAAPTSPAASGAGAPAAPPTPATTAP